MKIKDLSIAVLSSRVRYFYSLRGRGAKETKLKIRRILRSDIASLRKLKTESK